MSTDTGSEPFDGVGGTLYDVYIKAPPVARALGRVAWGLDGRRMYAHMERAVREAAGASVALDVPCGGGLELRWLRPDDPVRMVCVDGAAHMAERTRRYADRRGLERVEVHLADVTALPLADGEAEVVLLYNGIHHFREPERALAEVARCTVQGGRLFGGTFVLGERRLSDRLLRRLQRAGTAGPAGTRADVERWLRDAGFELRDGQTSGCFYLFEAVASAA